MCGIVGLIALGKQPILTTSLKEMCDVISHRGPDDAGYFVAQTGRQHPRKLSYVQNFTDQKFHHITPMIPAIDTHHGQQALNAHRWDLFLGHRRLAILDITSAGHQPMSNLPRDVWLAYNGEIYNFKEIRAQLAKLGYEFSTETDTEVLLAAYQEWGIECIHQFNGMFAGAIWDKKQQRFYLIRDRYGIKPLYYTVLKNGTLLFASEVKAILKYPEFKMSVDCEALLEYFTFQNIFTDKTLYEGVSILPAGHFIELDLQLETPKVEPKQYWDFNFHELESVKDEREYAEELRRLFEQAVERQLVSDVEVGNYLSGGMDSGSIAAVAASKIPYLKTFTVGFDLNNVSGLELSFDERARAEQLSYLYKTEHYEMVLKSGDMERCLPNFSWHLEEPRVGQSYPNYYAAKLASRFVKVVLSGAGGDELFGGYPWRYYRAVVNDDVENYVDKYYVFWQRLVDNKHIQRMFSPIWGKVSHVWTRDIFRNVFRGHHERIATPEDYVNHSLYFEAKTFLHGLLVVEDKLSMAHSLETRVPFLDNDLVDFAMKMPVNLKLGNLKEVVRVNENETDKYKKYFQKNSDGKLILRQALSRYMPESFTKASKQGFSSPDNSWFKGESIDFVRRELLLRDSLVYEFMDRTVVRGLVNEHLSGKNNRRLFVWSMLNFSAWCEHFL
ncbi:MAG: asparagine synthase (glutamine-hydrolyzing) [Gammaproteobacteria bacterium CG11_big_fil_rev_8_21_14_0_20_46_22]|nr:MAG: asparagine synthase (glutamine-hydrolyzing) [Gammaproteobacteria bacterium CG12_big_fil_rev_8_21_14_0_65_46_12]PIR12115.1 MAG: asparagine synthase (glutamine-hydrolyzing) [Gammaproteobacteria bacterium CG11_big_fil_rev_8_21_14_0_20_46_22]